jgi:hypothetical protein
MTEITDTRITQLLPRGTDRVRRRGQQAEAVRKAEEEIANLTSPGGDAKTQQIADKRAADLAENGPTKRSRKLVAQARHLAQADAESAEVSAHVPSPIAVLRPGQQVDHITARRFMKANNKSVRDHAMETAKAVAQTTLNIMRGKPAELTTAKPSRFRKVAQHAARQAKIKKT